MLYDGTSQGGGLGLWLCALNPHVTRATIYVPALTDHFAGRRDGRCAGWPQLVSSMGADGRAVAQANVPYFDGVNFARRIRIPIRVCVGACDTVCPPHTGYAAFNVMPSSDKRIVLAPGQGHAVGADIRKSFSKWLFDVDVPSGGF